MAGHITFIKGKRSKVATLSSKIVEYEKIMENVQKIQEVLNTVEEDVVKFGNGNKSAGTRIRKAMQEIKVLAQQVRSDVQTIKNS